MRPIIYFNIALLFLLITVTTQAQKTAVDCETLKTGIFYAYPKNTGDSYKIIRSASTQTEYSLTKKDSTIFKIKWINACLYSLEFLSSTVKFNAAEMQFLKTHKKVFEVTAAPSNFYIEHSFLDKVNNSNAENRQLSTDTIWMNPQSDQQNNVLFTQLSEKENAGLKKKFKDTSAYAVLYLYRPDKFMAMMNEYYVYCNNVIIFWALDNKKTAVKILNEGPITLYAKSGSEETKVVIDVKFGKKFYVECIIHAKLYKATPELKIIPNDKGEEDFEKIQ